MSPLCFSCSEMARSYTVIFLFGFRIESKVDLMPNGDPHLTGGMLMTSGPILGDCK